MLDITFSLITPVILGFFIGRYFDSLHPAKFPLWTVVCTVLGIITGMWSVYKKYIR